MTMMNEQVGLAGIASSEVRVIIIESHSRADVSGQPVERVCPISKPRLYEDVFGSHDKVNLLK
jgi:hypothetical protein